MSHKLTLPKSPTVACIPALAQKAPIPPSVFDALPDSAYVREADLVRSPKRPDRPALLPFSAPTLWRKVKDRSFPAPTRLSPGVTGFQVGSVRAWLANCAANVGATK